MNVAEYSAPQTLDEAVTLLRDGSAKPLAGGNALLVEPGRTVNAGARLVDLRRIAGLVGAQSQDGGLRIGAMTTLADVAAAAANHPALLEAISSMGDAQVRNRATIGGNLAEGDPGTDLPAVLIALNAQVQVQGSNGSRVVPVEELVSAGLQQGDLITSVLVPAPAAHTGTAYEKFKHPATQYAICGVAASVSLGADGAVNECTVAVTGATDAPTRLPGVENALKGTNLDAAALSAASQQVGDSLRLRSDHFASAEYRRHLVTVLAQRALSRAAERAGR